MNTQQFLKDATELVTHDAAVTRQATELQVRAESAEREANRLRQAAGEQTNTISFLTVMGESISNTTGMAEWNRQHPNEQKTLKDLAQWVKDHWKP